PPLAGEPRAHAEEPRRGADRHGSLLGTDQGHPGPRTSHSLAGHPVSADRDRAGRPGRSREPAYPRDSADRAVCRVDRRGHLPHSFAMAGTVGAILGAGDAVPGAGTGPRLDDARGLERTPTETGTAGQPSRAGSPPDLWSPRG